MTTNATRSSSVQLGMLVVVTVLICVSVYLLRAHLRQFTAVNEMCLIEVLLRRNEKEGTSRVVTDSVLSYAHDDIVRFMPRASMATDMSNMPNEGVEKDPRAESMAFLKTYATMKNIFFRDGVFAHQILRWRIASLVAFLSLHAMIVVVIIMGFVSLTRQMSPTSNTVPRTALLWAPTTVSREWTLFVLCIMTVAVCVVVNSIVAMDLYGVYVLVQLYRHAS